MNKKGDFLTDNLGIILIAVAVLVLLLVLISVFKGKMLEWVEQFIEFIKL